MGKQEAYSAEVGALTSEFEKSATELKPKQKLLIYKIIVGIAKLNIRNSNTVNQSLELRAFAAKHDVDIICIQEYGYYHSEPETKYHDTCYR